MFNVDENEYCKYEKKYPDILEKVANQYNNFTKNYEDIYIYFNQHLKLFPIINSWRIEICYCWDIIRMCVISSRTNYETKVKKKFSSKTTLMEIIYQQRIVEFYLENTINRLFSLLDKISHPINILYDLKLSEKEVSFMKIKKLMLSKYPENYQTYLLIRFVGTIKSSPILSYRHSYTHRKDPLSSFYELETIYITNELSAEIPVIKESEIKNVRKLLFETERMYKNITKFTEKTLANLLCEIKTRLENEHKEYLNFKV